jgi:hypothetical protein
MLNGLGIDTLDRRKVFFFKKKKQKTFTLPAALLVAGTRSRDAIRKSFWFFFQKERFLLPSSLP